MKILCGKTHFAVRKRDLEGKTLGIKVKVIQKTDKKGEVWYALPRTREVFDALTAVGFVFAPSAKGYTFPGINPPMRHQLKTVEQLINNPRLFVLNSMGTGKTISALWAADYLMNQGVVKRCLIIAPLSTLRPTWGETIFANFLGRSFNVLYGARERRLKLLEERVDFYIINIDALHIIQEEMNNREDINLVIIDELAMFRSSMNRFDYINQIVNSEVSRRVWGMTGEPIPNAPTDAFWQVKIVKPEQVGGMTPEKFKYRTMNRGRLLSGSKNKKFYEWLPKRDAINTVYELMQPAVRYTLEGCIDLPPITYQYKEVLMGKKQEEIFARMKEYAATLAEGKEVIAVNGAVKKSKLLQIASGVVYANDGEAVVLGSKERLDAIKEVIEQTDRKAIIFVPFTSTLNLVKEALGDKAVMVDGSVVGRKRDEVLNAFQTNPWVRILVANPHTMSHGLTLTAANLIIWYSPIYSNDILRQANARIYRISQEAKTTVVYLYATKLEREVYKVLERKKEFQDLLLELVELRTE